MKYLFMLAVVVLAAAIFFLTGCASPDQVVAAQNVVNVYNAAMADGVITAEEAKLIAAAIEEYVGKVGETNWEDMLYRGLSIIVGGGASGATIANIMRNRNLPGTSRKTS
jgi:hypothetical protein